MIDEEDKQDRLAYLDFLAAVLSEHEKNLSKVIERLNFVAERLSILTNPKFGTKKDCERRILEERSSYQGKSLDILLQNARNILEKR